MEVTVTPVKLKYAIAQSVEISGVNIAYTYLKVKAQKLESPQEVSFFYKDSQGTWQTKSLALEGNYGDYNIFEAVNAPYTEEFAIKYTLDGVDYWDSNEGTNYKLSKNNENVISGNVILNKATVKANYNETALWIEGEIYAKKVSYNKRIGIRFSGNDGNDWEETDAIYQGLEIEGAYSSIFNTPIEVWKFKTLANHYPAEPDFFRFAVYYKNGDNGESYWDNNFGQDYKISKIDGAMIE
jgi:Carbohydrate/starch-binding module (family 21)